MKIATFNVNNINRRLPNLLQWLKSARPDIACLQELKSTDANFPIHAIEKAGYRAVWQGEKTWNGVAILSRDGEPIVTRRALPGDSDAWQSRYLEAAVYGMLISCVIFQTATSCVALERPAVIAGIFVFAHDGRMGAPHFRHVGCNPFGSAI